MKLVVLRGGGDISSGVAHRLKRSGFRVVILDIEKPLCIRRKVSFSEAIYSGQIEIEGILGVKVHSLEEIYEELDKSNIPIFIDEKADIIKELKPDVVVDAILAKKNLGTHRDMAPITIGIGPGFEAGVDVDFVIESNRGHDLGRVIEKGSAADNTGLPGVIMGYSGERVIRATATGEIKHYKKLGDLVEKDQLISKIGKTSINAKISGVIRGLIKDGTPVEEGLKIGDIDPRGYNVDTDTISDKARAIGGGVLEAILYRKLISDESF